MEDKMMGKIKWYNQNKGYGYIIGSDGETYYFELINCVNVNDKYMPDDMVKFIPNFVNTEYANDVEKVVITSE